MKPNHAMLRIPLIAFAIFAAAASSHAQVPAASNSLNYQGRIAVDGVNFTGSGQFKFAILNASDDVLWTSTGDADADGVPDTGIAVPVTNGLYSTLLGDATARQSHEALRNSVLIKVPHSAHMTFVDQNAAYLDAVARFLESES